MNPQSRFLSAFSLVELLVTISVIAIIAAIALPAISNITQAADSSKTIRNAQTVAATFNAAIAAGMPISAASTPEEAIDVITAGTNITFGMTSAFFSVDGLTEEEQARILPYLGLSDTGMLYSIE